MQAPICLKTTKIPVVTTYYISSVIFDRFITMIREFIARLRERALEIKAAFLAKVGALVRSLTPASLARAGIPICIVSTQIPFALSGAKRYRLESSHAPIFSLYTFFGDRRP